MIRHLIGPLAAAMVFAWSAATGASAAPAGRYDPAETFAPLTLPEPVNSYRSADGTPGPGYWQNRADYEIHARLDPSAKLLSGTEIITYTNNSPSTLDCLWLQLDQNIYREGSRSSYALNLPGLIAKMLHIDPRKAHTEGYQLDAVEIGIGGRWTKADTLVSDTRLQIRLAAGLKPHTRIKLRIAYHYTVPGVFGGRTAWAPSKNGEIFDIAQWYPRMAVFDDMRGWDTLPYLGNEFYLEYGDFDYSVTVPADMLVAGSGELQNPKEVLTAMERARLDAAAWSDKTIMIRTPEEVTNPATRPKHAGELTWHFKMKNSRDVAFAASRAFVWDAARINLPGGRHAMAMSFYPVESAGPADWGRSTEYVKDSAENFSRRWMSYPWPNAVAVAGPVGAMEYPAIVFDDMNDKGSKLFVYTAHEIGHTWFPMVVGSNERRDAWMDEGFNTFIDIYESNDFNHGEFAPKRDPEFAPGGGNPVEEIEKLLKDPAAPIILSRADQITFQYSHPVSYFKAALGLQLLREQILGPERFDFAFRKYIRDWSYKHPSPSDFFRAMNSAGGEDLSWFWRGWFMNNWNIDLAATAVVYTDGDPAKGATVTITSLDKLVMPATVEIVFTDGTKTRLQLPAEAWIAKAAVDITVEEGKPIASVTVDPDGVIPDADRSNNVLKGSFAMTAKP
jgi:hypothetical protein